MQHNKLHNTLNLVTKKQHEFYGDLLQNIEIPGLRQIIFCFRSGIRNKNKIVCIFRFYVICKRSFFLVFILFTNNVIPRMH